MAAPIEDMKKLLDLILKLYDKNERNVIGKIYGIKAEARQRLAEKRQHIHKSRHTGRRLNTVAP